MKKYCLDTSGLSTPLEWMPQDIHVTLWQRVGEFLTSGQMAVSKEIYDELARLPDPIGSIVKANEKNLVLEVGDEKWKFTDYLSNITRMQIKYKKFISEFNQNCKGTIGQTDLTIIALGKTLMLPVISMENKTTLTSPNKRKIPDVCAYEDVLPMTFNEFLRAEGISN